MGLRRRHGGALGGAQIVEWDVFNAQQFAIRTIPHDLERDCARAHLRVTGALRYVEKGKVSSPLPASTRRRVSFRVCRGCSAAREALAA